MFCLKITYHGDQMSKFFCFLLKTNNKTLGVHVCTYTHAPNSLDKLNWNTGKEWKCITSSTFLTDKTIKMERWDNRIQLDNQDSDLLFNKLLNRRQNLDQLQLTG